MLSRVQWVNPCAQMRVGRVYTRLPAAARREVFISCVSSVLPFLTPYKGNAARRLPYPLYCTAMLRGAVPPLIFVMNSLALTVVGSGLDWARGMARSAIARRT